MFGEYTRPDKEAMRAIIGDAIPVFRLAELPPETPWEGPPIVWDAERVHIIEEFIADAERYFSLERGEPPTAGEEGLYHAVARLMRTRGEDEDCFCPSEQADVYRIVTGAGPVYYRQIYQVIGQGGDVLDFAGPMSSIAEVAASLAWQTRGAFELEVYGPEYEFADYLAGLRHRARD